MDATWLAGKWTYRSYFNNPELIRRDCERALRMIFAEAMLDLAAASPTNVAGVIDWGSGGLDLQGTVTPGTDAVPMTVHIVGSGRPGTQTDGWQYDYHCHLAYAWANGVNQVPALVGSVIRAKPHGGAPAGVTASFIAVKRP
jgi:hypothetical protein